MRLYGFGNEEIVGVPGTMISPEYAVRVQNPEQAYTVAQEQRASTSPVVESVAGTPPPPVKDSPNWLLWGAVAVGAYWFWKKKK